MLKKDYEALSVVGFYRGNFYILESVYNRGHEPDWTIATFFNLATKWQISKVIVESVAYQRTLAWLLRKAMTHAHRWWMVEEFDDKRAKPDRISQGLQGVASNGRLYIRRSQSELISQFTNYPNVTHEDVLESVAVAVTVLERGAMPGSSGDVLDESGIEDLPAYRSAP
jgi:phage terminase large subunit-like protein